MVTQLVAVTEWRPKIIIEIIFKMILKIICFCFNLYFFIKNDFDCQDHDFHIIWFSKSPNIMILPISDCIIVIFLLLHHNMVRIWYYTGGTSFCMQISSLKYCEQFKACLQQKIIFIGLILEKKYFSALQEE